MDFSWVDISSCGEEWERLVSDYDNPFHSVGVLKGHRHGTLRPAGIVQRIGEQINPLVGGLVDADNALFSTLSFVSPDWGLNVEELLNWLRSQGFEKAEFGSYYCGLEGYVEPERSLDFRHRVEFLQPLSIDEETWWRKLSKNHRRKLNKAKKLSFVLRPINYAIPWTLAKLSRSWAIRRGIRRGWSDWLGTWLQCRRLTSPITKAGCGTLYGLYDRNDALLSVAYMLESASSAFYMMGASTSTGYSDGASVDLLWQLGLQYRERGMRTLNLGGVPAAAADEGHEEHGVFRFKKGYGIEPVQRIGWTVEVSNHEYARGIRNGFCWNGEDAPAVGRAAFGRGDGVAVPGARRWQ